MCSQATGSGSTSKVQRAGSPERAYGGPAEFEEFSTEGKEDLYELISSALGRALGGLLSALEDHERMEVLLGASHAVISSAGEGIRLLAGERARQMGEEGFSVERDRELYTSELARASQSYVAAALYSQATGNVLGLAPDSWPWPASEFKPSSDPARNLVKAGALIAAELDRMAAS